MTPKEQIFLSFLLSRRMEQRLDILRHLSPHELKLLVEIILNVVHGVITISSKDYNILDKNKTPIRKVIQRGTGTKYEESISIENKSPSSIVCEGLFKA